MNRRVKLTLVSFIAAPILAGCLFGYVNHARRKTDEHIALIRKSWASRWFLRIQPSKSKVLMMPAPVNKAFSVPVRLYALSDKDNHYWTKPRLVGKGFEFGFFDGARYYRYKVVDFNVNGVELEDLNSIASSRNDLSKTIEIPWK